MIMPVNRMSQQVRPEKKILFAVTYWWYPWYGAQWIDASGTWHVPEHENGLLNVQKVGMHPLTNPIPYLQSEERPDGSPDQSAAITWFYQNFKRMGQAGIDVALLPMRPDLQRWQLAVGQMHIAQHMLQAEGLPFPLLSLMPDGVEYWDKSSPDTGDLTQPGIDYQVIMRNLRYFLAVEEVNKDLYLTRDDAFVLFFYRIEGGAGLFKADNWWLTTLRKDFASVGVKAYFVMDEMWCGYTYGGRQMSTCNGDNWFLWGANVQNMIYSKFAGQPVIANITAGFDGTRPSGFVANPQWLFRSQVAYELRWFNVRNADWVIVETWNFMEEDSLVDITDEWGNEYIQLTRQLKDIWVNEIP